MATPFLTIDEVYDVLVLTVDGEDYTAGCREELAGLFAKFNITDVNCSSSLDFPEESTQDRLIIEAARALRNGEAL
jgi:hypothetical protein